MANELQKLSKNDLVKQAEGMRRRAQRYKKNAETTAEKLMFAGAGGLSAFVLGYYMGGKEKEFNKLVAEKGEEEAKKADPRVLFGIPADAAFGVTMWVIGLTGVFGRRVSPVVEAVGFGGLSGFLYNWGTEMALEEPEEEAA